MSKKGHRASAEGTSDGQHGSSAPGRVTATARRYAGTVLRKPRDGGDTTPGADEAVARAADSSGAPLPSDVQGRFEGSLGADLSSVRVHTGAASSEAASAVGARAYALGNDIHFASGEYAPADPFGLHLLAHEVAHTQQQAGGAPVRRHKLDVSTPGDAAEVEADRAADAMVDGAAFAVGGGAGPQVARSVEGGPGGGEGGGGAVSGTAPPSGVPKWYQLPSTAEMRDGADATIYFGTDDDGLTPDDLAAIKAFIAQHKDDLASGQYEVEILGYADKQPGVGEDYNMDLSSRRAARVYDELGKELPGGMPAGSTYEARGQLPSSNNPDDLARQRRVEIRLRKPEPEPPPPPVPMPVPNLDPPRPKEPGWSPPADWSTDWELSIAANGGVGEFFNIEGASLTIKNLKTGEQQRFGYAGVGIGVSAAPASPSWGAGPYQFKTTAPVPIKVFASSDNAHVVVGAATGDPGTMMAKSALAAAGINIPNGVSGEVWVLTGPHAAGADVVYLNTSGGTNATPNIGILGTIGPTF